MVTVVDCANLLKDYASHDFLRDRGETAGEGDERSLVDLLVKQIEFSDVIVLNKVSTATDADRHAARTILKALNPSARIVERSDERDRNPQAARRLSCSVADRDARTLVEATRSLSSVGIGLDPPPPPNVTQAKAGAHLPTSR